MQHFKSAGWRRHDQSSRSNRQGTWRAHTCHLQRHCRRSAGQKQLQTSSRALSAVLYAKKNKYLHMHCMHTVISVWRKRESEGFWRCALGCHVDVFTVVAAWWKIVDAASQSEASSLPAIIKTRQVGFRLFRWARTALFEVGWHKITAQRRAGMSPGPLSSKPPCGLISMEAKSEKLMFLVHKKWAKDEWNHVVSSSSCS